MRELRKKAMAKINLGLDVLRRRPDGYHDLRMVMQTVTLCDEITLRVDEASRSEQQRKTEILDLRRPETVGEGKSKSIHSGTRQPADIHLFVSGGNGLVPADQSNLAYRAAQMLMEEFDIREYLEIVLEKHIPAAAGLAGGSSDAAAVLTGVNELFGLNLSEQELMQRGAKIGADVPYCIMRGTALAEGIGDRLTRLAHAPEAYVVLAKPPVEVSTKFVYTNLVLDDHCVHPDIDAQIQAIQDGDLWRMAETMGNMLEKVTIPAFPVIGEIKEWMMQEGAVNAMMSGSGPTVFGLYDDEKKARRTCGMLSGKMRLQDVFLTTFYWP
ncbi:MAG: 4-(cytidine 5'-diphospho)-2-C-methyl-D-erythritol kinase [Clostridiales bacterium]|nr:4-(cytidine 5'-diphospho)-2-C-methyl-D-erythritol kinase [Clostridiales bacterium]